MTHARIVGLGAHLPERRVTNADLEQMVDTSDEWITTRTGISERRFVAEGENTSDLAAKAGLAALADANLTAEDVDMMVLATSSPEMLFPSTSCLTQEKMGLTCPAVDVMAACTGFIYALHSATTAIESGRARTVLVIGADAISRLLDMGDRSTCVIFGDGAGALVLQAADEPGVLGIDLGAQGSGSDLLEVRLGSACTPTPESCQAGEHYLRMAGSEVFKFAVRIIPASIERALAASRLTAEDLEWVVPHQANQRIMDTIGERLGIPNERVFSNIARVGNTSAASIPLAMTEMYTGGKIQQGDVLALVGFGAGLTWGAAIVRWTKE